MEFISDNKDLAALMLSALAVWYAYQSKRISAKALKLSEKNYERQFKELTLYLVSAEEWVDADNTYYLVRLKISNPASVSTSIFQASLVMTYRNGEGAEMSISLNDNHINSIPPNLVDEVHTAPLNITAGSSRTVNLLFMAPKDLRGHGKVMQSKVVLQASDERKYDWSVNFIEKAEE